MSLCFLKQGSGARRCLVCLGKGERIEARHRRFGGANAVGEALAQALHNSVLGDHIAKPEWCQMCSQPRAG